MIPTRSLVFRWCSSVVSCDTHSRLCNMWNAICFALNPFIMWTHIYSCSMHLGMSDDTCGPAQQLSLCIVGRSTCLSVFRVARFSCRSRLCVHPSMFWWCLGQFVEIVSILGDVFGVLAIGKSVTSSIHPIAHNMHSVCARVSLFER